MQDLGFTYLTRNNEIVIYHHGKEAGVLRGKKAIDFSMSIEALDSTALQHKMARITGNYKRGNEKQAKNLRNNR